MFEVIAHFTDEIAALTWAGSIATLSTLAIYLWCELLQNRKWLNALIIAAIAVAIADYFYITESSNFGTNAEFLGRGALATALLTGIFFPPVVKHASLKSIFNFSVEQFRSAVLAVALSIVLAIAILIINITISVLFHWESDKLLECLLIMFSVWLPGVFFLNMIAQEDTSASTDISLGNATIFVLLPIAVVYTLILYVYGLKILFQWELPQDSISIMVSGLLCVVLVTIYGLQAFNLTPADNTRTRIASLAARWLPAALLPLIILMTIGLIYRVNQYGITISRLYLATFNLWAYAVVIYMSIRQQKARLNSIAASFAVVFALVSIFPYLNYSNLVISHIRHSIFAELGALDYPVSIETIQTRLKELPENEAKSLASRIVYYYRYSSKKQIAELTDYDSYISDWTLLPDSTANPYYDRDIMELKEPVEIPEGYKSVKTKYFSNHTWDKYEKLGDGLIRITRDSFTVTVNIDTLANIVKNSPKMLSVPASTPDDPDALFTINEANIVQSTDSLRSISGYMFQH